MKPRIGMIGIGLMGHGIATNLVRHGYALTLLEHPGNQPLDALVAAGATLVGTPAAVAAASDVVLVIVTGSPQVEAVLTGPDGEVKGLKPAAVVIECSTAIPSSTERMAVAVQAAGGRFMDAAMTRTPKEAAEGRLNLLIGADPALLEECRPVLACFAENITHAGPVGAGHRMKLLHNFVSLGSISLLSEAAACAARSGIATDVFVDVLAKGGGGGTALERIKPFLKNGDTSPMRFSLSNAAKDLSYYTTMAEDSGAAHAIAGAVRDTLQRVVDAGHGADVLPELIPLLGGPKPGA